jgi:hypothetical protein
MSLHYMRGTPRRSRAMPRTSQYPKETSFNLRIDPGLKAAFTQATAAEDKPAAQVVRDFMRAYVRQRARRTFEAAARRQSLAAAARAREPGSDEHAVMREIEAELADDRFWQE